jgi:hypothetical protein
VVTHEAAHVRARDPLWQLLGELACALYWFHPLVHLALRQLRFERELAADDQVLTGGMRASAYARLLYELACVPEAPAAVGAVVPLLTATGLKARVAAALRAGGRRSSSTAGRLALGILGALIVVPLAAAIPVARDGAHGLRPGTGMLIGRLIDEATGQPIGSAEVGFRLDESPDQTAVVTSDAAGWFRYPDELPWNVTFSVYARSGGRAARTNVSAVPYGTRLPVTLALRPATTLTGAVRSDEGPPVAGATVRIIQDWTHAPGPHRQVLARTDREGRWRVDGMLYGKYRLLVQAPWGVGTITSVTLPRSDAREIDTVVGRTWPITGWVRDEQGAPLAGVRVESQSLQRFTGGRFWRVSPERAADRHMQWDESAADGSFRLLPLDWRLGATATARDGTRLFGVVEAVEGRDERSRGSLTMVLRPGAELGGVVRDETGRGLPGLSVIPVPLQFGAMLDDSPAVTDARGRFVIHAVPAGEVELIARDPDRARQGRLLVRLRPGQARDGLEIVLASR